MEIRDYQAKDERKWVYTKTLSYLFSPFFDDMEREKTAFPSDIYQDSIELVAWEGDTLVGLLDIGIYNRDISQTYAYYQGEKVAYFTNLAVHPDYQGRGIAQALFERAKAQLLEKKVQALAIFTREGDAANHLYQKWGGQLVCKEYLVVGLEKGTPAFQFQVDKEAQEISLKDKEGAPLSHYLREGIYIVAEEKDLDKFDIDQVYQEFTYLLLLAEA